MDEQQAKGCLYVVGVVLIIGLLFLGYKIVAVVVGPLRVEFDKPNNTTSGAQPTTYIPPTVPNTVIVISETPVPERLATQTPIPTAPFLPDTPLDSILNVGETWRKQGLELTLQSANLSQGSRYYGIGPGIEACVALRNFRPYDFALRYSNANFWARDNQGRQWSVLSCIYSGNCRAESEVNIIVHQKEGLILGVRKTSITANYSDCVYVELDATDPNIISLEFGVRNISDIGEARWTIPIHH